MKGKEVVYNIKKETNNCRYWKTIKVQRRIYRILKSTGLFYINYYPKLFFGSFFVSQITDIE